VLVILGPQRFEPTVRQAVEALGVAGPLTAVTAGWQEREGEDRELEEHLGCQVLDLRLYHRTEEILRSDPELGHALHERQEALRELQDLYRLRLAYALDAARELARDAVHGRWVLDQRRAAVGAVRTLDRLHLRRIRRIHEEFAARLRPTTRPEVASHRAELAELLRRSGALCIAGGHVAVLVGRLRLFELEPLLGDKPVIAWSAGAMALSERIVLFHDSPPQGPGNPEVLDAGLALCRRVVLLPHAHRRLKLDDRLRVALFARRFAPATCVVLDGRARLAWDGRVWKCDPATRCLDRQGRVRAMVS
jgi:hypothetical protein